MPRLLWPSCRWMTISGTPSRASSTACVWRSWCGANRRRTPARTAVRRRSARAAALAQCRPRVWPLMTHSSGPTGSSSRVSSHGSARPSPTRPCRPRDGARPCRAAPGGRRGADRDRPRRARVLPGRAARRATGSRSVRVAGGRCSSPAARMTAMISSTLADRPDSAAPCCPADDRRGSLASSPAIDVDRHGRAAARTWPLLGLADEPDYPREPRPPRPDCRFGDEAARTHGQPRASRLPRCDSGPPIPLRVALLPLGVRTFSAAKTSRRPVTAARTWVLYG